MAIWIKQFYGDGKTIDGDMDKTILWRYDKTIVYGDMDKTIVMAI